MRARILTHVEVKKAREARREEIDEALRLKKSRDDKKQADTLATDAATVASLLQQLRNRDESAEQDLRHCTKEDFSKISAPELREFIFYRSDKFKTKSELKKVTKGNLAEANQESEGGSDNKLISLAFDLRCAECKLEEPGNSPEEAANDMVETLVIPVAMDPTADWKSPHNILSKPGWIEHINSIFNSGNTLVVSDVNEEVKRRAASLARTLLRRFEYHLSKRVLVEYKRSHPILKWFRKNIPAFAAYMVLFNHVKKNTSNLSEMDCLLTNSMNNFLLLNANNQNVWGAYLVHDSREEKHVRSGKCTGRGMVERWSEHRKNASSGMNSNSSKFGDTYPSRNSARASGVDGRCFEDLNQYAAAAFEPTDTAFDLFQKDFDIGGLFCWAPSEKDIVCRTKISGCSNDGHKFAAVVAYGFEMCYDIAISRRDNLSESPGFEAFGLMHGG